MKANDFITIIGDMLGEDFVYNVIWSRSDILSYLRKTLRRFSELTMIVDRDSLRFVDRTTGESVVTSDFANAYYGMYEKAQIDLVQLGELDFVTDGWSTGVTATMPVVGTILGAGASAIVRVIPVPSNPTDPFGTLETYVLRASGGSDWVLGITNDGAVTTTSTSTGTPVTLILRSTGITTYGVALSPTSTCTDPDDDTNVTTGWSAVNSAVLSSQSNDAGGYCLRIAQSGAADDPGARTGTFTTTQDEIYEIRAKVRLISGTPSSCGVSFYTGAAFLSFTFDDLTTDWKEQAWSFRSFATYTSARLYLSVIAGVGDDAVVEFDDVTLKEIVQAQFWEVKVNDFGVVTTYKSTAITGIAPIMYSPDVTPWRIRADSNGALLTDGGGFGKIVRLQLDGVDQDFTSDLGGTIDAYAYNSAITPTAVARLDKPFGSVTYARMSEGTLHLWYKGLLGDVPNTESQIYLTDCYLPIVQHGVLALAYSHEGQGRDTKKARVLDMIFKVECESVKRIFNRK